MKENENLDTETSYSVLGEFVSGLILLYLSVIVILPVALLFFTKTGNLYLFSNQEHYMYFFSICNLLFGEIAVISFGIWGAMRSQKIQQHKRSWILTLLLGILWLSVGVFGLMS
ncbi:hypothetical protein [Levilactobacillus brevis]|uniref:hypothetical protein n=1 Tax=Levilactobacillus brevis TaxID=1580 RepID=UPI0011189FE8|nr:hypothetical protein [Levilactobacillus brevis]MBS0978873.1 hypothetical protein [Levilactobacillus brevis]QCZ44829.1 hypothetical protein UCCLBBS124_pA0033 [Levilactobacillus brevis]